MPKKGFGNLRPISRVAAMSSMNYYVGAVCNSTHVITNLKPYIDHYHYLMVERYSLQYCCHDSSVYLEFLGFYYCWYRVSCSVVICWSNQIIQISSFIYVRCSPSFWLSLWKISCCNILKLKSTYIFLLSTTFKIMA